MALRAMVSQVNVRTNFGKRLEKDARPKLKLTEKGGVVLNPFGILAFMASSFQYFLGVNGPINGR
jgi:hypothetical protein